ncbi:uncharacterized protein B0T23DRAFT_197029 [Neurospora hispaniola]|uniref:Uncharacterized protein n=1 Tax=Neurospora hispaniola TaxID=588809 RepID=A0AAJ0I3U2_9PEZI|nr:hypothetical protein B0T23DRAFT_197029 [Neurospora hispaniola]
MASLGVMALCFFVWVLFVLGRLATRFISFSFPMIPMAHRCISFHHGWSIHWTTKASIDGSVFLLELFPLFYALSYFLPTTCSLLRPLDEWS